jgi:hypothetical protein
MFPARSSFSFCLEAIAPLHESDPWQDHLDPSCSRPKGITMTDHRPLAFVTGASSGIGYELAKQLAQHGYDVAISGSSDRVHESRSKLRELGGEAWSHQADASTHTASRRSGASSKHSAGRSK